MKMKNSFDGIISRLDTAEERIKAFQITSIETSQIKMQREKRMRGKKHKRPRTVGQLERYNKQIIREREERENRAEETS